MKIFIGCSGYYYNHWKTSFYPEKLPKSQWLIYYSQYFNTVEINNTFYRMPEEKAVKNWYSITPSNFIFSVKGSRFITHMKKLSIDNLLRNNLNEFQHTAALLKDKSGPILWQLPGNFMVNLSKLEKFCAVLSKEFNHVFEFRNESWFSQEVFDILTRYQHGLCIVSGPHNVPHMVKTTSDNTYIRFHGEGSWYSDNYSNDSLEAWKSRLEKPDTENLFAYFNNDINAYAVRNAQYLSAIFTRDTVHSGIH